MPTSSPSGWRAELVDRWRRSPAHSGLLGIAWVALATLAAGLVCAVIAVAVTLLY